MAMGRRGVEASRSEPASCLSSLRTGHKLPFDIHISSLCQSLVNKPTQFWEGREREEKRNPSISQVAFQILLDLSWLVNGE